ncbi:hypothetical protein ALO80_102332 [Pseudomonas caricapapayae]|nr:hypothetical protein ALO80_102332 [Pseudomonas caricapapayae]
MPIIGEFLFCYGGSITTPQVQQKILFVMTEKPVHVQVFGKDVVYGLRVQRAALDIGTPVTGEQLAIGCECRKRAFDKTPQIVAVQVVTQLAEYDQIEFSLRPLLRQARLPHLRVRHACKTLAGQINRQAGRVAAHQSVTPFGKIGTEFAVGTTWFEYRAIALAGQGGKCQRTLAPLVPTLLERPRIIAVAKQLIEITVVNAHVNTTSNGCSSRSRTAAGRIGASPMAGSPCN